uniref:Reverse transcriptase domain-containing protein n=1 Tax=Cannabis sativa TaxID=3483 RepID=A0A803NUT9_CANSA
MLLRMGFGYHFVSLIMSCKTTVNYNVTYGGRVMGPIHPGRGIRQGDPLSPYLFLVCAEGLSSLLKHYEHNRWLTGCQVARSAPRVSHMLFADDSYVYCKANDNEAERVLQLLQVYQRASGQQVNQAKSSIFFSKNTNEGTRKKIFSWDSQFLSKAGKEVLLKSVAQALPCYAMSVFLLTQEICSNLEGMMSKFWWKSQTNATSKGVSWMSWKKLCRHKNEGGIGFRDLRNYNLYFLGKQGWRLLTNENSLVSMVYKARYYPTGSYLTAEIGQNPSFIWRSIFEAKGLVCVVQEDQLGVGTLLAF